MRLWHELLIPYLPRMQLTGQHRECCALRGNGWGRRHSVVNYVFDHPPAYLVRYHFIIMDEMKSRWMHPDKIWLIPEYRGKNCDAWPLGSVDLSTAPEKYVYTEHDGRYLRECVNNLADKGITIKWR